MKKVKKSLLIIIPIMIFIGIACITGLKSEASGLKEKYERRNKENEIMLEKIMKQAEEHPISDDTIENLEHYEEEYDEYAGKYYTDDGELVVCFTDELSKNEKKEIKQEMTEIADEDNSDVPTIEYVDKSYSELETIKDNITQLVLNQKEEWKDSISGTAISEMNNSVIVYTTKDKSDIQKKLEEIFDDSEHIKVENEEIAEPMLSSSVLYPGQRLYISKTDTCSIGFPVLYYNSQGYDTKGIITAGHANPSRGLFYTTSSLSKVAANSVRGYYTGQKYDARLLCVNKSLFSTSKQTYYSVSDKFTQSQINNKTEVKGTGGATLGSKVKQPIENEIVVKIGGRTGYTMGRIDKTSVDKTLSTDNTVKDVFTVKTVPVNQGGTIYLLGGGDSGGVVYSVRDNNDIVLLGIVTYGTNGCSGYDSAINCYMGCSKAQNILSGLNCRYY